MSSTKVVKMVWLHGLQSLNQHPDNKILLHGSIKEGSIELKQNRSGLILTIIFSKTEECKKVFQTFGQYGIILNTTRKGRITLMNMKDKKKV
jgi:hypothetical protein